MFAHFASAESSDRNNIVIINQFLGRVAGLRYLHARSYADSCSESVGGTADRAEPGYRCASCNRGDPWRARIGVYGAFRNGAAVGPSGLAIRNKAGDRQGADAPPI